MAPTLIYRWHLFFFFSSRRVHYNRWTRRHFLELLLLSRNSYKVTITVSVPNVSYSTGRITRHNQPTRLFTCLNTVPPAASTKAISIQRYNPIRRKSKYKYRLQHRNPQIAVSDNPADNPIRVSFFRSVSFCLRLTTYPLVNSLPRPAIHVAS